jgi:voltage-gated potassium channel
VSKNIKFALLSLVIIIILGTLGYSLIEKWGLLDSLYMTIITITTVGFTEVRELTQTGKIFTLVLIIGGVGVGAYTIGSITQSMVEGELRKILGRRKLERQIKNLTEHYIVCGFGRIGSTVSREFAAEQLPFIVIEKDHETASRIDKEEILYIEGDATQEEILVRAGIEKAKGIVAAAPTDVENVYITLTARELNPDLFILARADDENSEKKLHRAGANKVISPYSIGGLRMAQAILRPNVMDFIELATQRQHLELQLEEIKVGPHSHLLNTTLKDSEIRQKLGLIIVAIKTAKGKMIFNPPPEAKIEKSDVLIALGETKDLNQLEEMLNPENIQ